MSFVRNTASVLVTSTVLVPIGLVAGVVVTRNLSVDDRGMFGLVTALTTTAVLFLNLGWPAAAIYRLKRLGASPPQVIGQNLVATAATSAPAVALGLLAADPIRAWLGKELPVELIACALVMVPLVLVSRSMSFIAQGIDRFDIRARATFVGALARLVGLAAAWWLVPGSLLGCVVAVLAAQALATLYASVGVIRAGGVSFAPRDDSPEVRRDVRRFATASYTQNMLGELHEHLDILMLGALLAQKGEIAIYGVAVTLVTQLKLVPNSIATALFPHIAGERPEEAARFVSKVSRHSTLLALLSAVGLALVGPPLVRTLYGEAYAASAAPLWILLPGMAVYTVYRVLARYFVALGRQRVNITTQALAVTVNVALNFVLIPRHGAVGAAIASLVSYSLEAVLIAVSFMRASGQGFRETFVFSWSTDSPPYLSRLRALRDRLRRPRAR